MSDNVRRYRAIRQALDTVSPQPPQGNGARHVNTRAALINGIVGSQSTHLPALAGKMVDGSHLDSRVKKYARWLQNERVGDVFFTLCDHAVRRGQPAHAGLSD